MAKKKNRNKNRGKESKKKNVEETKEVQPVVKKQKTVSQKTNSTSKQASSIKKTKHNYNGKLSLVIPIHNHAGSLGDITKALRQFDSLWDNPYELIIVDRASDDDTASQLRELYSEKSEEDRVSYKIIELEKDKGQGGALKTGMAQATGDHVLTLDPRMTTRPGELMRWLNQLPNKTFAEDKILIGSRADKKSKAIGGNPILRMLFNFFASFVLTLRLKDMLLGFKLYPRKVAHYLASTTVANHDGIDAELMYRARMHEIEIEEMPVEANLNRTAPPLLGIGIAAFLLVGIIGFFLMHYFLLILLLVFGGMLTSFALDMANIQTKSTTGHGLKMVFRVLRTSLSAKLHYFLVAPIKEFRQRKNTETALNQKESSLFRLGFALFALFLLFLMPMLSFDYGATGDEYIQKTYGEYLIGYFESGGDDDRFMGLRDLYNYGGLFDYAAAWCNKYIGWFYPYDTRHFLNSLFGVFMMFFVGLTARQVSKSWAAALLAIILVAFSPRMFGHSMNNPKDIPFAAAYIFTIYHTLRFLAQLPKPSIRTIFMVTLGIALSINMRVGGIILIAYLGLFTGMAFLWYKRLRGELKSIITWIRMPIIGGSIAFWGFMGGLVYWPYGAMDPFVNPFKTLSEQTNFSTGIQILFNDANIWSDDVPWNYIPTWFIYTTPLVVLLGALIAPIVAFMRFRKTDFFVLGCILFVGVFPVSYAVYQGSALYDGMRHFLFAYIAFPVLAAWGWWSLTQFFETKKVVQYILSGVVGTLTLLPAFFMIANHPYQYVYFNELKGGISGAYSEFETDYWQTSMKGLSEWVLENKMLTSNPNDTIKISLATNCYEPVKFYIREAEYKLRLARGYDKTYEQFASKDNYKIEVKRGYKGTYEEFATKANYEEKVAKGYDKTYEEFIDPKNYKYDKIWKVPIHYVRYHEREKKNWDYGLYYSRYVNRKFLKNKVWPAAEIVHTESVGGIPVGVVTKREGTASFKGANAMAKKDFVSAVMHLEEAIKKNPKNESILLLLAQAYSATRQWPEMKATLDSLLALSDEYPNAHGLMGVYHLNTQQNDSAIVSFTRATELNFKYTFGYYHLGRIYTHKNEMDKALEHFEKFDKFGGKPKEGYTAAIQAAQKAKDNVRTKYFQAKQAGTQPGGFQKAYKLVQEALALDRNYEPAIKAKKSYDAAVEKEKAKQKRAKEREKKQRLKEAEERRNKK